MQAQKRYMILTCSTDKNSKTLETGVDLAGKKLKGSPKFCIGAVANPTATQ
jgi:hypothetical protein